MPKKPPASYASVELTPPEPSATELKQTDTAAANGESLRHQKSPPGRTLKEAAAPVMLYLHPAGAKALKRYALDQNTKVHSLLIEAVEAWFKSHGLREPVRVQTEKQ